jgi:SEC-C motif
MNIQRNRAVSTGRNDPCLCGSGKKYKKCCLKTHEMGEYKENLKQQQSMQIKTQQQFPENEITFNTSEELGIEKMSDIILDFADDMLRQSETKDEEKKAIMMAIIAWNLALLKPAERKEKLNDFVNNMFAKSEQQGFKQLLQLLIEKKLELYPDINRHIINFEILDTHHNGLHLNVASTILIKQAY